MFSLSDFYHLQYPIWTRDLMRFLVPRHVNIQNNAHVVVLSKGFLKSWLRLLACWDLIQKHGKIKFASAFQSNPVPGTVYTLPTHAGRLVVHKVICCWCFNPQLSWFPMVIVVCQVKEIRNTRCNIICLSVFMQKMFTSRIIIMWLVFNVLQYHFLQHCVIRLIGGLIVEYVLIIIEVFRVEPPFLVMSESVLMIGILG